MRRYLEIVAKVVAFLSVAFVVFYFFDLGVSLVFTGIFVAIFFYLGYQSRVELRKQLKRYEEAANELVRGNRAHFVTPLSLEKGEVLGPAYNELIKYVANQVEEAKKSEQLIKSVTTVIDAPLVIVGEDGIISYANRPFRKMIRRDSLRQVSYEKIKDDDVRRLIQDALIRAENLRSDLMVQDIHYRSIAQPLFDETKFVGVVILFHDVTEIKSYQNLQRDFFTNASHELKTPITAIKGAADILLSGQLPSDTGKEFLEIIKQENERLENLVQGLILINRFDANEIKLNRADISLIDLFQDILVQTEAIMNLKRQTVIFNMREDIHLEGDYDRLFHCFLNLATNAVHYSPDETVIRIVIEKDGAHAVEISISDEGIGIPKADLPYIFDRFYRVDKDRARHSGGTGLGLSIVKSTIEAHGGKIKVKSEEGTGTTFTVRLPTK